MSESEVTKGVVMMSQALQLKLDDWLAREVRELAKTRQVTPERYVVLAVLERLREDRRTQWKAKVMVNVNVNNDDGGSASGGGAQGGVE